MLATLTGDSVGARRCMANSALLCRLNPSVIGRSKLNLLNSTLIFTRGFLFKRSCLIQPAKLGNSASNTEDSMAARQLIDTKIAGKKVMVFSKSYCPFCTKAKQVFKQHIPKSLSEEDYEVLEIENRPDCDQLQAEFKKMTGGSSVS